MLSDLVNTVADYIKSSLVNVNAKYRVLLTFRICDCRPRSVASSLSVHLSEPVQNKRLFC